MWDTVTLSQQARPGGSYLEPEVNRLSRRGLLLLNKIPAHVLARVPAGTKASSHSTPTVRPSVPELYFEAELSDHLLPHLLPHHLAEPATSPSSKKLLHQILAAPAPHCKSSWLILLQPLSLPALAAPAPHYLSVSLHQHQHQPLAPPVYCCTSCLLHQLLVEPDPCCTSP